MTSNNSPLEIHVHGQLTLRENVTYDAVEDALKPLWTFAGAENLSSGSDSSYEDEPGIKFDSIEKILHLCWTISGNVEIRQVLDEVCMNLNELAQTGAAIEVTFYDPEFENQDDEIQPKGESRDDLTILFVGPNPASIIKIQRDLLISDVLSVMQRHFDDSELADVLLEIDKLFNKRLNNLVSSLDLGKPPRGSSGGHNNGRKPRHLH